jgi:acid phosphatase
MKSSLIALSLAITPLLFAQSHLEVKYVRDGAEYATAARQVYRQATTAALDHAVKKPRGSWGVVLDVDETTLDNSVFELDRGAYDLPFDSPSWNAWVQRAEAGNVPGVKDFLDAVRKAGGRVAFITDRASELTASTRENLVRNGLMTDADLLCLKSNKDDVKGVRRKSVATGEGPCSWSGVKIDVVAFMGDQMGDFPQSGEAFPGAGTDAEFGRTFFILPNPMYGGWTTAPTRVSGSVK